MSCLFFLVVRDNLVGIATCYELDGPGIESRRGRDFLHPSGPALGPNQSPMQWVPGLDWLIDLHLGSIPYGPDKNWTPIFFAS